MELDRPRLNAIILSYLSLILYGFLDNARGPIFSDVIGFFGMSHLQGSLFFSLTSGFFMLGAIMAPSLIHARGYRKSFMEQIFFIGIAQLIFFFADHVYIFLSGCVFMGFGVGVISVMQNVLVMEASPPRLSSRLVNGLHANYAFASFLAPLIVSFFYRLGLPFKTVFGVGALFTFGVLFYILQTKVLFEPRPSHAPRMIDGFRWSYLTFATILSLYVAGEVLISSRLAQFLSAHYQLSKEQASDAVSLFFLLLLAGRLLFSFFPLKFPIKRLIYLLLSLAIVMVILGTVFSYWYLILIGFVISPLYALIMLLGRARFQQATDRAASLAIFVSGIMIIIMNSMVGWMSDQFGIYWAVMIAAVFFGLSLLIFALESPKYVLT